LPCLCPECHPGLIGEPREHSGTHREAMTARDHALLAALFNEPVLGVVCDGSMTCPCNRCVQGRARLVRMKPRRVRQPWQVQRAA
jgi:hypothetical protein